MYNHRPMAPVGPGSRFSELLEALRMEFEKMNQDVSMCKMQRDEFEHKISTQLNEVSGFQQNLYELERAHQTVRQQYEDEIMRLRRDLEARGTPHQAHQPAPPNIGDGPSNLFGGIMSGTPNGPHSLVAPPQMMDPNRQPQSQHPGSGSGPPGLSAYSSGGLSGASHQQLPPTHGGHQALNKRPRDDSNAPPYHMGGQSQPSMLPLSKYGSTPMSTSLPGLMGQGSGQPQ